MLKKAIVFSLLFCLVFPGLSSANEGSQLTTREEQEQYVINKYGISKEFAQDLTDKDLKKFSSQQPIVSENKEEYFRIEYEPTKSNNNKGLKTADVESKPIITKLTKEQALAEVEQAKRNEGAISPLSNSDSDVKVTDWLRLETNMTYYANNGTISNYATWLKDASNKKLDILALGVNQGVAIKKGTASFSHKAELWDGTYSKWDTFTDNSADIVYDVGGVAAKFDLFNSPRQTQNERAYISVTVLPREGSTWKVGSVYDTKGYYRHQETQATISPSVSLPLGGSLGLTYADKFADVNSFCQLTYKAQ
ncbi:hypothetical protein [Paenibacillus tuaregi]|uniref:hypothetical protein n=1 Tax=Paenibacillus tuaregi TaxID=1816681 RepID=UPI000838FB1C|nr:hypothetical protein [Paenibacillus tuaregi]